MILLFIGTTEIIAISAVVLLLFGGKKLPELMRGLGKGVKDFKKEMNEIKEEVSKDENPQEPQQEQPTEVILKEPKKE